MQYQQLQKNSCGIIGWNLLLASLILLSACSTKGDFGRPRQLKLQEISSELAHEFLNDGTLVLDKEEGRYKGDPFALTKPEILIRDAALHFSRSLTKRHTAPGQHLAPTAYAEYMTSSDYTHGKSRMGVVSSEIRNDFIWLKRFSKAAARVKKDDGERAYYLATKRFGLTDQDRIRTHSRIKENEQIVYGTFKDIDDRIASYRYALERTPLESPGTSTGVGQTALGILIKEAALARSRYDKLARRIARRRVKIPSSWKSVVKRKRKKSKKKKRGKRRKRSSRYRKNGKYTKRSGRRKRVHMNGLKPLTPKFLTVGTVNKKSSKSSKPGTVTPSKPGTPMSIIPEK